MAKGIKTGGRKKGTPNKTTKVVEDIVRAFYKLGGTDWLVEKGGPDPRLITDLLKKVLPSTVQGPEEDGSIKITVSFKDD